MNVGTINNPAMIGKSVAKEAEADWKKAMNYWFGEITERKYQKAMERERVWQENNKPYRYPPMLQKLVESLIEEECKRYALTQGVYVKLLNYIDYEIDWNEKQTLNTLSAEADDKRNKFFKHKADRLKLMRQELQMHIRNTDDIISKLMHTTARAIQERLQIGDLMAICDHITSQHQDQYFNQLLQKRHAHQSNSNT